MRLVGEKLIPAVAVMPVPLRLAVCGDPAALSVTVMLAEKVAAESGVNFTAIVQEPPAVTALPQLFVCEKSAGLAPPGAIEEIVSVAVPVFESVRFCAALVLPTSTLPNDREPGERFAIGAVEPPAHGDPAISGLG